jgi:hypothetical protein
MGGRTQIIPPPGAAAGARGGKPNLVTAKELELGTLRRGDVVRGKVRVANNGTALLTGTARVASDSTWLHIVGTGTIYCAAGAVESVEVEAAAAHLPAGQHTATVIVDSDGGQGSIQVRLSVAGQSRLPFLAAAVITAAAVISIVGLLYAGNARKTAVSPPTLTRTATVIPVARTATPFPTATAPSLPSATPLPPATATSADTAATATAAARQVQQLVAHAEATATALAASANATRVSAHATATAESALVANQAPDAAIERQAIQAAVDNFLQVREQALKQVNAGLLPAVATGKELQSLQQQIAGLQQRNSYTKIVSIDPPIWDSIQLNGPTSAVATVTKHESEIIIRNATGLPDDQDPSYHGKIGTLRNQHFAAVYQVILVNGQWLVADASVIEAPSPLPTPQPDLLPPSGGQPVFSSTATPPATAPSPGGQSSGSGTATPVATVSPSGGSPSGSGTATPVATVSPSGGPSSGSSTATPVATAQPSGGMTVESVVKLALPSVLRVTGTLANNQQSTGTGFVIKATSDFAYVVTNDHVVHGAANVTLSTQDGTQLPAITIQEDGADDLAVIKVAQPSPSLPALGWGDSNTAQLGENVVAIGFALGLQGEPTISTGIISALHRDVGQAWPYLQHTAAINHGNSGGPLLDLNGDVVGINTLLDENAQSIYFAIPSSRAAPKIAALIAALG